MKGMQGKLNFLLNALGMTVLLLITVTGLKDSELSEGKVIITTVSGLCTIGSGINIDNKMNGFILFMKK